MRNGKAQCRYVLSSNWMKVLVEEHFLENYTPTLDSIQINKDLIFHKVGLYGKLVGRSKNMLLEFTNQPTSSGRVL